MTQLLSLTIELAESDDLTRQELDELTRSLLNEIDRDIKPDDADLVMKDPPPGARAAGAVTIGAIALALAPIVVDKLVTLLIDWSKRNEGQKATIVIPVGESKVTIEYNPSKTKPEDLKQMVADAVAAAQPGGNEA